MWSMTFDDKIDCLHPALVGASLVAIWNILSANVAHSTLSWLLLSLSLVQYSPCALNKVFEHLLLYLSTMEALDFFLGL